jgi:hypothetical protein
MEIAEHVTHENSRLPGILPQINPDSFVFEIIKDSIDIPISRVDLTLHPWEVWILYDYHRQWVD